jgi:hypothetical protein
MKSTLPFLTVIFCTFLTQLKAQTTEKLLKIYGYEQRVQSGVNHEQIEINTQVPSTSNTPPSNSSLQYFVYIELAAADRRLTISRIWIKQKLYSVKMEPIRTPIIINKSVATEGESVSDTLIKATEDPVWLLNLAKITSNKKNIANLQRMILANDIVVEYCIHKSRYKYTFLDKVKVLPTTAMW